MPRGGKKGNKGNLTNHVRKWQSTDFATPKLPRHLMPVIYQLAIAMDHDPELADKLLQALAKD